MNNHHSFQSPLEGENTILFANSGKAAKEQAEHQLGNFLKTPLVLLEDCCMSLALLGVDLKNLQSNKIWHFVNYPYLCKGLI